MTITYGFDHELPSGQACYVEAEIEPEIPARINCLPEDAEPASGGYAEVTSVTVYGDALEGGTRPYIEVDMENVWVACPWYDKTKPRKFVDYLEDLAESAYDKWAADQ